MRVSLGLGLSAEVKVSPSLSGPIGFSVLVQGQNGGKVLEMRGNIDRNLAMLIASHQSFASKIMTIVGHASKYAVNTGSCASGACGVPQIERGKRKACCESCANGGPCEGCNGQCSANGCACGVPIS